MWSYHLAGLLHSYANRFLDARQRRSHDHSPQFCWPIVSRLLFGQFMYRQFTTVKKETCRMTQSATKH